MSKEICDWKMSQLFWRNPALPPELERESPKPKRLLSSQIHFILDYSNMVVKSTKESTSQSFQRNFLMKRRKCCGSVDNQNANRKMNRNHFAVSFLVLHAE
ncbi:MAG: hypothetical protein A2W52_02715 [Candidatus Taylorbacteria bacterium RIFCSPHIGHO2_02_49_25]|uniref:Uncharacterized protein n=1 Tax=Candidatus Taylorbacteria bacterium RIFCSPHIGHO2_02_49_25 TaxID=1802305 RepID=A0A1G2MEL9_9BACT|nr:MAG: hypothetical protein A2W52_02715 [Candidatus Taylorbacteria bacterium RIFCSPHIGHO2_02_49_25]